MGVHFIRQWQDLQFNVDSERLIFFEKLFHGRLFALRVSARNLLRENRWRNIFFFHISFWCLTWDTNPGFTSNKPTHYLLDYGDFNNTNSNSKSTAKFPEVSWTNVVWSLNRAKCCIYSGVTIESMIFFRFLQEKLLCWLVKYFVKFQEITIVLKYLSPQATTTIVKGKEP